MIIFGRKCLTDNKRTNSVSVFSMLQKHSCLILPLPVSLLRFCILVNLPVVVLSTGVGTGVDCHSINSEMAGQPPFFLSVLINNLKCI